MIIKCQISDCLRKTHARKLCRAHYTHFKGYKSIQAMHKIRFGGLREQILKRDHYRCVICKITNQEHKELWNRNLTINHIDHQGRYSLIQNNSLDNLETLCLRCHGSKDAIKHGKYAIYYNNL